MTKCLCDEQVFVMTKYLCDDQAVLLPLFAQIHPCMHACTRTQIHLVIAFLIAFVIAFCDSNFGPDPLHYRIHFNIRFTFALCMYMHRSHASKYHILTNKTSLKADREVGGRGTIGTGGSRANQRTN